MSEPATLDIRFKILGSSEATSLSIPSDITTESLQALISDFCTYPAAEISLVYKGRALKPGDTLSSRNVGNNSTIFVSRQHRPAEAEAIPLPQIAPPTNPAYEEPLGRLIEVLGSANGPITQFQSALSQPDPDRLNGIFADLGRSIDAVVAEVTPFTKQPLASATWENGRLQMDGPVISQEDREEMLRIGPTLETYAKENELADIFKGGSLYNALGYS
jgi:hypothetical protein